MKLKLHFQFIVSLLTIISMSCTQDLVEPTSQNIPDVNITSTSLDEGCSSCSYTVPANMHVIDGKALGIKPGNVICLDAAIRYGNLLFRNIVGKPDSVIKIRNCGGNAIINGTGLSFAMKTEYSKYFKITGGSTFKSYGIQIEGGHIGLTLDRFSTNFEVDHLEVRNVGFAGIMAKTDPSCDDATIRGNFLMTNVTFHDNYVHDSGGEGFYIGNSFFANGAKTACGLRLPHEVYQLKLYNNIIENSGWDGIQVGSATRGAKVYGNSVENYGRKNVVNQRSGIQLGEGTGGVCYGNFISTGTGHGMNVLGLGDNVVHDNIIVDAGGFGIFCDERYSPGKGFKFIHNTIVNPASDGIRIYADLLPENAIINNIIASPGSIDIYSYPRTSADAYVYKLSSKMVILQQGNFFTDNIDEIQFVDVVARNFRLKSSSPLVDKGTDVSLYRIGTDYFKKARLRGLGYDIGASELQY